VNRSRIAILCVSLSSLSLLSAAARAHHVVSDLGIAPVLPASVAGVSVGTASFDVAGMRGRWVTVTPQAEVQLGRHLSLLGTVPLARVDYQGGASHNGLGDVGLSAKLRLYASDHGGLLLSAGLGVELPTGDDGNGLGGGHAELAPFAVAASTLWHGGGAEWIAYGLGSLRMALGAHDHVHNGPAGNSMLSPHAQRELFGRLMTALVKGQNYAGAGLESARVLSGGPPGYLAVRGELGTVMGESLRLFLAVDGTVAGQRRYGLRGQLGSAWLF
jgi:hypothetical protein